MTRVVAAYLELILRHRVAVVASLALVTVAALWTCSRAVVSTSLAGLFFGDSPHYQRYVERAREFGSDDFVVVAFEDDDLLSAGALGRLERAVEGVARLSDIGSVGSVLDAQRITGDAGTLRVEAYADAARVAPDRRAALLAELAGDPLMGGLFVSEDGRATAVVAELRPDPGRPAERVPRLVEDIQAAFEAAGFSREELHLAGFPVSVSEVVEQTYVNILQIFPFCLVILLVTVWVCFRRLLPVLVTAAVALVGVVWTTAFSVLLDPHLSILTSMVPPVILIVGFSDVVHLCSAYLTEVSEGRPREEAVRRSGREVGAACLLTSLTTFLGFVSMAAVPTPAFRILGVTLGVGVGLTLLLAMTLTPVLLSWLPTPRPWRGEAAGGAQRTLDAVLSGCTRLATRRPVLVAGGFGLLLAATAAGLAGLHIETDFTGRLPPDSRPNRDADWIDARLAGSHVLEVYVEAAEDGGLLREGVLARLAAAQERAAGVEGVDRTLSLVDLVRELHGRLAGPGVPASLGVPTAPGALAQYLLLFEMSGGERPDRLIDFERRSMRLSVRLSDGRFRETARIGDEVAAMVRAELGDELDVEPAGLQYLLGDWLEELLAGQLRGLAFAFLSVALVMVLGLRSLRVGLWSMVPNTLPVLALGGLAGALWDQVDSDLIGIAMMAVGIGVDDTIHFLMRLRIEWSRHEDPARAVRAAMGYAGRGIVITTVILVLGFAPCVLSDYLPLTFMGTLLPLALVVALLADLLLVPALVQLGAVRYGRRAQAR